MLYLHLKIFYSLSIFTFLQKYTLKKKEKCKKDQYYYIQSKVFRKKYVENLKIHNWKIYLFNKIGFEKIAFNFHKEMCIKKTCFNLEKN